MSKKKKKAIPNNEKQDNLESQSLKNTEVVENEEFDFGGLPKNISLKRNIGCGG